MLEGDQTDEAVVPDEVLALRARLGEREAFGELFTRYQTRIHRLVSRMCPNPCDVDEIAQETFLKAHGGIGGFAGESLFRTWLHRIAVNQVLMHRRAAARRPAQSLEAWMASGGASPAASAGGPIAEGGDEVAYRRMLASRVLKALAQLDEPQRAVLVLRDLQELSSEEAAGILGVSPDLVRQRAHRARRHLREQLRDLAETAATR
ncbi:MAG TPA: sigma-70 family RNA polymerase sigma factor [Polyangiaceae bacterium]|jgi:RNA polymerase sigma-70 factor (ECF subfamily)|nr:sigma-70 family RNA polymerase sigma factor [Polyangiaceae bacterium]